ncbi:hypothetical protein [Streptomyces sp. NPDC046925]|uniref:hypothetical protein n=1 Tax=Streptomyces sp. NPDC046925 TaxID=3155375 RepID=UPI0033DEE517
MGAPSGTRPREAGLVAGAVERWTVGAGGVTAWFAGGSAGVVFGAVAGGVAEVGAGVGALGVASDVTGAPRPGRAGLREALRWTVAGRGFTGGWGAVALDADVPVRAVSPVAGALLAAVRETPPSVRGLLAAT